MSSNQSVVPQPRRHMPGFSEPEMPYLQGHDGSQVPEGLRPQATPGSDSMHQQELPGSEGLRIPAPQASVIHPLLQPGIDNIRPTITVASEGNLRPIGPLIPESVRFSQPAAQMMPQPGQPIITQSGAIPSLLQPGTMRHGSNPRIGMARPNLMGFAGMTQGHQNPRILQQTQPVNLLAQGLLNQVASNMMSSTLQNMPDLAASLRALTQLNTVHPHGQPQMSTHPVIPPVHRHAPEDDHSAAMITGMQGSLFLGQQKMPVILPQQPVVPIRPLATVAPPLPIPVSVPLPGVTPMQGPSVSYGIAHPAVTTSDPNFIPGLSQPSAETTSSSSSTSATPSIDINNLLNKLLQAGLIKEPAKTDTSTTETIPALAPETAPPVVKEEPAVPVKKPIYVPDLTDFDTDKLRQTHAAVIEQLHEGVQCHTCAARFTLGDHEKYRAHLDWHFRQNKLEQEMVKVAKNRKWFYSIPDWVQYEELEDTMEKSRSEIFEQMRTGELPVSSAAHALSVRALEGKEVVKNPVASGIEGEDVCATCGDPFDQMWNEDTEEWILKNTIKVDGKTYHPVCYEDAQETPTPVTVPTKNPLELELQSQPKTVDSSSSVGKVLVKPEPMDITEETPVGNSEAVAANLQVKSEIKPEPSLEDSSELISSSAHVELKSASAHVELISSSSRDSTDLNSAIKNGKCADSAAATSTGAPSLAPPAATTTEVVVCQGPTLLSTIATTVVREVIPVSHEDPMSPWEMDSNPTPELSRTPTPEPIRSFTPAQSLSSESISSLAQGSDSLASEEPLPPAALASAASSGVSKTVEGSTK
ncbi:unnamed protein product [Candidula unifasciata]|uniref:Pcf11 C-terminal domain-containing protein n=1 Tax=Candidula unifasciata TaxID=100452 RepID=A0A8S4A7P4_9EUPU|nr:unnamed protein product [Candidula unifasciata]